VCRGTLSRGRAV